MKVKPRIEGVLGFALFAMWSMFATVGTAAEENPGQTMADVSARLEVAARHAESLEKEISRQMPPPALPPRAATEEAVTSAHDIGPGSERGSRPAARPTLKITRSMNTALDGLEAAVAEAKALAGSHEALAPGFEHVLANSRRMRGDKNLPSDAHSLGQEIVIELFALANNAHILEAEADLHAASAALSRDQADALQRHLEAASRTLSVARDKGAYHLEDDIATLGVVLARLKKGAAPREAVTGDAMDELIGDVHDHLADLRGD